MKKINILASLMAIVDKFISMCIKKEIGEVCEYIDCGISR